MTKRPAPAFRRKTHDLGLGIDVSNIGEAIETLDGPTARCPLDAATAWARVVDWLEAPAAWVPQPGPRYAELLGKLITGHDVRGNLIPDAQLAAHALEHGLTVCSTDGDFARFAEVRWQNPLIWVRFASTRVARHTGPGLVSPPPGSNTWLCITP